MIFQTFDEKNECKNYYINNKFIDQLPDNVSKTWSYSKFLKGKNIDYANLYVESKTLEEICPEIFKKDLENINKKINSINNSLKNAKISLKENCFYDFVPNSFLEQYCDVKNKICEHIFENYDRPKQYDFYRRLNELLFDIKDRNQNIDLDDFKNNLTDDRSLQYYRKLLIGNKCIEYNLFGAITGRLSTTKDSFPILSYPKKYRKYIKPHNDWFLSFDMNAAELRTSLALIGKQQTSEDLYEMLKREVYENKLSRTEVKEATTAWLYNSNNVNAQIYKEPLEEIFNKKYLKEKYWDGKHVYTPFDRIIQSDEHHAISYLNQSTFIDLFHRQVLEVYDYLSNKQSFISFLLHDQFVIDLKDEEKIYILDIIKRLENTIYGIFPVKIEAGRNFGEMKKLNLKV